MKKSTSRIIPISSSLADNPKPTGYKKLKGRDGYRIRVADYRIIYDIFDDVLLIDVITLDTEKIFINKPKAPKNLTLSQKVS